MRPGASDHLQRLADVLDPPFRQARLRSAAQHACWVCEDPRTLSVPRLNLILWYVDRNLYLRRGQPLSGVTYIRHQFGPRARPLEAQLRELERDGLIARRLPQAGEDNLLFALAPADLTVLDPEEVSELEAAVRGVCLDVRSTIAHRAAHDTVWRAALIGEILPYFTACAGRQGELLPADIAWATRQASGGSDPRGDARVGGIEHPRGAEAVKALLWHLRRDPALGISLPVVDGSWFVCKQAGIAEAGVPEVTALYRFELDELLPAVIRLGPARDELEDES